MNKIGKIQMDLSKYCGNDNYSDGKIEDELLEACINDEQEKLLYNSNKWPVLYHLSSIRENILEWYPIKNTDDVLEIGAGCGAITGILSEKSKSVTCVDLSKKRSMINAYRHKSAENIKLIVGNFQDVEPMLGKYDIITLIGVWEYSALYIDDADCSYTAMLKLIQRHLKPNGKILIAIENKTGLKYWNGASEDHTGKQYSGLNDYIDNDKIRTFSKREIEQMLIESGIEEYCFYYPYPDYKLPDTIYTDNHMPEVTELRSFKRDYASPRIYNFMDATVSDQICEDNMFGYFSNSYLIVCGESVLQADYIKYNRERKEEYRIASYIRYTGGKKIVVKKALSPNAINHILQMKENEKLFKGIYPYVLVCEGWIEKDKHYMNEVEGESIEKILFKYRNKVHLFVEKLENIIKQYFIPNENQLIDFYMTEKFQKVFGNHQFENHKSLRVTNIDMILSNMRLTNSGELALFDCEWVFDFPIPYEYTFWRMIRDICGKYYVYQRKESVASILYERFKIDEEMQFKFLQMESQFVNYVFGMDSRERYTLNYVKPALMQDNRFV